MSIGRTLSIAILSATVLAASAFAVRAQDACADSLAQIEAALQAAPPAEGDVPTIQALVDDAMAKQAAGDVEGCAGALAQIKQMLQIQ